MDSRIGSAKILQLKCVGNYRIPTHFRFNFNLDCKYVFYVHIACNSDLMKQSSTKDP